MNEEFELDGTIEGSWGTSDGSTEVILLTGKILIVIDSAKLTPPGMRQMSELFLNMAEDYEAGL